MELYVTCPPSGCEVCPHRGHALVYRLKSRRRGDSLGINLHLGAKVCSFDCIYCFRGLTAVKTLEPVSPALPTLEDLERALSLALDDSLSACSVDFSGNGEPTLHSRLSEMVSATRKVLSERGVDASVGIFTNSSTLLREGVVRTLLGLDHIEAKLDTADSAKFEAVNRPVEGATLLAIVEGLRRLRKAFQGSLAIQVMLVELNSLTNARVEDARRLAEALSAIEPDEVHVHTVYRKPQHPSARRPSWEAFAAFALELESWGLNVRAYYD